MANEDNVAALMLASQQKERHHRRLALLFAAVVLFGATLALILYALGDSVNYYRTPATITQKDKDEGARLRLGGFVRIGSIEQHGAEVIFSLSDGDVQEKVRFNGILPDLFREGQGVVVEGRFELGRGFVASRLLAKHDERYISRQTVEMLKEQGKWQDYPRAECDSSQSLVCSNSLFSSQFVPQNRCTFFGNCSK